MRLQARPLPSFRVFMSASPAPKPPSGDRTNASIQGLRGMAAFAVMMYHMHYMSAKAGFTTPSHQAWAENVGPYSVLLFFCISGYLIVSTLCKHGDLRRFALNRATRVYPLFLLLHLVMFTLGPWMNYEWMGELRHNGWAYVGNFFSNLFFLPGMLDLPIAQKNAWSLSYEAAFYLLVGTIFAGAQQNRRLTGKIMFWLGWLACAEACLLEPRLVFFAIGTLVWWLDKKGLLGWPSTGPLSLIGCLAGLYLYSMHYVWLSTLAVLPFFVDVVRQSGWLAPVLRSRVMNWMGKISYSLYLIHPFVFDPLRRIGSRLSPVWGPGMVHSAFIILGAVTALLVAAITHELIEVRLTRRLLKRAAPKSHCPQSSGAPAHA